MTNGHGKETTPVRETLAWSDTWCLGVLRYRLDDSESPKHSRSLPTIRERTERTPDPAYIQMISSMEFDKGLAERHRRSKSPTASAMAAGITWNVDDAKQN